MAIFMRDSLSMGYVKVVELICGKMAVNIMATSSKGIETGTAYGRTSTRIRCIRDIIC